MPELSPLTVLVLRTAGFLLWLICFLQLLQKSRSCQYGEIASLISLAPLIYVLFFLPEETASQIINSGQALFYLLANLVIFWLTPPVLSKILKRSK